MKSFFKILKLLIGFFIFGIVVLLLTNKTFIYDNYKSNVMAGSGIPIKRFTYFINDTHNEISFITPLSKSYLEEAKNDYLKNLDSCYGKYYYDKDNNITITSYQIYDSDYYRNISIQYDERNFCGSDYFLSDMWVYEYISLSHFVGGNISEKAMAKLIDKAYMSKRVEDPIITDYEASAVVNVECSIDEVPYTLLFQDFSDHELLVKKTQGDSKQIAVYEVENVVDYLNSLKNVK